MAPPIRVEDYIDCCRCCFQPFNYKSIKIVINSQQQRAFEKLTGVELRMEPIYSKFMCTTCVSELRKFMEFRGDAAVRQKKLYECSPTVISKPQLVFIPTTFKEEPDQIASAVNVTMEDPEQPEFEIRECYVKLEALEQVKLEVIDHLNEEYVNESEEIQVYDLDTKPWYVSDAARNPINFKANKKNKRPKIKKEPGLGVGSHDLDTK